MVRQLGLAIAAWALIAGVEVIHGILRVRFLNPRVGDHRARQIAVFSGSALIFLLAWFLVPPMGISSRVGLLGVGLLWLLLMLAFEIVLGRWVFHLSWKRIGADFDLRRGGLLAFGMLVLFLAPLLVMRLH